MTRQVQFRRGTTSQISTMSAGDYEFLVNLDNESIVQCTHPFFGGHKIEVAREDASNMSNPLFGGAGALKLPRGTTAQRPGTPAAGQIRYNTSYGTLEYYQAKADQYGYGYWKGFGDSAKLLYSRSATTSTYTASLNENLFNFNHLVFRHSNWRNLYTHHIEPLVSKTGGNWVTRTTGTGNVMLDSYSSTHCYVSPRNNGNEIYVGSGSGELVYEIWGIR